MGKLDGKTGIVTGAGRNIGEGHCPCVCARGSQGGSALAGGWAFSSPAVGR